MKLDFGNARLLAVVAHPDDAELLCAGTLARAKAEGAAIAICVLCNGDKGRPANSSAENLAEVRREEMKAATGLLGAELFLGEYPDGALADDAEKRAALVEVYRKFDPSLVLAHSKEDYHADHRAAGTLAEAASWFCASRGHRTASSPAESPPELWWMDTINMGGFSPGFYVDISAHAEIKSAMLACHKSQLARAGEGDFASLEDLMRLQCAARGAQSGVAAAEAFRIHHAFKRVRAW